MTRYTEEAPVGDAAAQAAHGSRARALAGIARDIEALEGREAADIAYSAAVSADWSGTSPTTIAEALDRLAAALGPIP